MLALRPTLAPDRLGVSSRALASRFVRSSWRKATLSERFRQFVTLLP